MSLKEGERRNYSRGTEVSQEDLVRGNIKCPFTPAELDVFKFMRDGVDGTEDLTRKLGIKLSTFKSRRAEISGKVGEIYTGGGSDNLIKGLSLSVLGGWLEEPDYKDKQIELDKLEYAVLFQRCFGHTAIEVGRELHITPNKYNELFMNIKGKLALHGENQIIAWGACQAKKYLLENSTN